MMPSWYETLIGAIAALSLAYAARHVPFPVPVYGPDAAVGEQVQALRRGR